MINFEKKVYSQNGEDGILEYIFSQIGTTNQIAVEFGAGDGLENNTRLLADNNWNCFWLDNGPIPTTKNVTFKQAWLTADNIAQEFQFLNIPIEFDLLSIDVDGNDYHLREALSGYRPRVIVQEYNGCYGANDHYVMPRDDNFSWTLWNKQFGASLLSLTTQADRLGYDLIYCESQGVNAFYVRRDINIFTTQTVQQAWKPLWWADKV